MVEFTHFSILKQIQERLLMKKQSKLLLVAGVLFTAVTAASVYGADSAHLRAEFKRGESLFNDAERNEQIVKGCGADKEKVEALVRAKWLYGAAVGAFRSHYCTYSSGCEESDPKPAVLIAVAMRRLAWLSSDVEEQKKLMEAADAWYLRAKEFFKSKYAAVFVLKYEDINEFIYQSDDILIAFAPLDEHLKRVGVDKIAFLDDFTFVYGKSAPGGRVLFV